MKNKVIDYFDRREARFFWVFKIGKWIGIFLIAVALTLVGIAIGFVIARVMYS